MPPLVGGQVKTFHPAVYAGILARRDVPDQLRDRLQSSLGAAYTLERELGGGGMSRVFLARERALDRRIVVKVLHPDLAGVNVDRFRREIQVVAQLQHPHIVPVLASGESLRAWLLRESRLPVDDVVRILHDVADALAYAHERGVVHRDIKPDNVLVSRRHAMVTDFGISKALAVAGSQRPSSSWRARPATRSASTSIAITSTTR